MSGAESFALLSLFIQAYHGIKLAMFAYTSVFSRPPVSLGDIGQSANGSIIRDLRSSPLPNSGAQRLGLAELPQG
jgi:hypothetical protein